MNKNRRRKNRWMSFILRFASSISVFIFIALFAFLIRNSWGHLNLRQLVTPYWPKNQVIEETIQKDFPTTSTCFQSFGLCLKDETDLEGNQRIVVVDLEKDVFSPYGLQKGSYIESLQYTDENNSLQYGGKLYNDTAQTLSNKLSRATSVENIYFQTQGGGVKGSLIATIYLLLLSLLFAVPSSLLVAIYLNEYAQNIKIKKTVEKSIEVLAGVPSLMFGLMGLALFFPVLKLFHMDGLSILLGSLTISIMLLPTLIRMNQEALQTVPNTYREASYALGARKSQTIFKIILPQAFPSLISSVLMGASRVLGESAALIYTMGTFINDKPAIKHSATSLTVHLWSIMQQEQVNMALASSVSLYILFFIIILNISARLITQGFKGGKK